MADGAKQDSARRAEVRTITYLAPGVAPDTTRDEPTLDPELAKIRDREAKALSEVKIDTARKEPSIDPELVKARDEQIKRERERAGVTTTTTATDEPKTTAKKASPSKSKK